MVIIYFTLAHRKLSVTLLPPPNLVIRFTCKLSKFMTNVLLSLIPASIMVLLASITAP